jgi:Ni,Fe-hydrogenase III small subunit
MEIIEKERKSSQMGDLQTGNAFKRATRPLIYFSSADQSEIKRICPANAIGINPVRIDLGKCVFCHACAIAFPSAIKFSDDPKVSTNVRDRLIVIEGEDAPVCIHPDLIWDNRIDSKLPINLMIVGKHGNSDIPVPDSQSKINVQKESSSEKAHGLIFTEEITEEMEEAISRLYEAMLPPKLIILAGAKAISSGIFNSKNNFMEKYPIDLYVPGNFVHPMALADAVNELISLIDNKKK